MKSYVDDRDGKPDLAGSLASVSTAGPPLGSTVLKFPVHAAARTGDTEGADVSSASASSFVPLSVPARAVVMRLQGKFPRVKVLVPTGEDDRDQR